MFYKVKTIILLLFSATMGAQSFYISSRNNHSIKQYDIDGNYIKDIVPSGQGGLSFPQEVLYHNQGFLLITGRGNTSIKKYDINTGAYLGNFTTGYNLDNPTKTTIYKDSLIYVSQWGQNKNKVVRFNYKTGAFIDEFTSIGIPNGCGHTWDAAGNLYVAQFGSGANGKIYKFNEDGQSLGIFINTGKIYGPVNVWNINDEDLYVVDWTQGNVQVFDLKTGAFKRTFVEGLVNVEGYAFDKNDNVYLCDWTQHIVYKIDKNGNKSPFITNGNLASPNSIIVTDNQNTGTNDVKSENIKCTITPNPVFKEFNIHLELKQPEALQINIIDIFGKIIRPIDVDSTIIPNDISIPVTIGQDMPAGKYFLRITMGSSVYVHPFIKS
jgi:hypothetical protein